MFTSFLIVSFDDQVWRVAIKHECRYPHLGPCHPPKEVSYDPDVSGWIQAGGCRYPSLWSFLDSWKIRASGDARRLR